MFLRMERLLNAQSSSNQKVHCYVGELAIALVANSSGSINSNTDIEAPSNQLWCSAFTFNLHLILLLGTSLSSNFPLLPLFPSPLFSAMPKEATKNRQGLRQGLEGEDVERRASKSGQQEGSKSTPWVLLVVLRVVLTALSIELPVQPLGRPVRSTRGGESYSDRLSKISEKIQGNQHGKKQAPSSKATKSKAMIPEDVSENAMAPPRKTSRSQATVSTLF